MTKIKNILVIALIAILLMGIADTTDRLHKANNTCQAHVTIITKQTKTIDSLKNATSVYDTLLNNMLADTSKINVNVVVKLDNPACIKKEKRGIFRWFK
jgi:maltose-binding protein MalE